jgi:hypothetical protein
MQYRCFIKHSRQKVRRSATISGFIPITFRPPKPPTAAGPEVPPAPFISKEHDQAWKDSVLGQRQLGKIALYV